MTLSAAGPSHLTDLLGSTSAAARARAGAAGVLPVLDPLAPLLPGGGLARGTVIEVSEASLLLALATGPLAADPARWAAAMRLPDLGLAAAASLGLPLQRLLVADDVDDEQVGTVVAALADACAVLLVRPPARLAPRTTARLDAHLRRTGTVMLCHGGTWPTSALRLEVTERHWGGLGEGHGQLDGRRVRVRARGRGSASRPRSIDLWLPDFRGQVAPAPSPSVSVSGRADLAAAL